MKTINVTQAQIETYEDFSVLVKQMEPGVLYMMPETFYYRRIEIDIEFLGGFSWTLERNFDVAKSTGFVFPTTGNNMVKTFKTEAGAKRNLIKYIHFLF